MPGFGEQATEPPLIAVVGPTASGKTAVGIALAHLLRGEIISADAVAVYRDLNIGAAKPDAEERRQAVFHLLDVVEPDEDFTLADFEQQANAAISEIRARGRVPILVGGTGLYVRSVTATLTVPNVPPQSALREALWQEVESQGAPALHLQLANIDVVTASKVHPGDAKRIIRALEVYRTTGQPLSAFHTAEGVQGVPRPNTLLFGLRWERETLYKRIEERVDTMMASGFLEEVRELQNRGFGAGLKSMQSLGYRHLLRHLSGEASLEEMVAELKRDTRRYAKRQISWFNADSQVRWIDVPERNMTTEAVAAVIYEQVNRSIKSPP
ncbi:MAG: tRNA (adenosine(37)-N6)-dimethylallyltransferase MiaA [Armatimonadota bacterium]